MQIKTTSQGQTLYSYEILRILQEMLTEIFGECLYILANAVKILIEEFAGILPHCFDILLVYVRYSQAFLTHAGTLSSPSKLIRE